MNIGKAARWAFAAAAIAATSTQASANARPDLTFRLMNESTNMVYSVFVTPVNSSPNGLDLLGDDVIEPGQAMVIRRPASEGRCQFDVHIVFDYADGPAQTITNVNLCEPRDLTTRGYVPEFRPYTVALN
jgi:hypothetical protein